MSEFEKVKYVRQCCFSILPQVYCDRFSITDQIGKIVKALNGLIENNNKLEDYVKEIIRDVIESGEIEEIIKDMLANYILNVKFPPNGITPAVGDGSKDDTESIQGCIDYAFTKGGMAVYFPSGSYLTNSIDIKNNVGLIGFDVENTKLVLKGGATRPLINGNVTSFTLNNLSFDGNGDYQVNNLNTIDLFCDVANINNIKIFDGYKLLNLNVSKLLQANNIYFGRAVTDGLVLMGTGVAQCTNLYFDNVSLLNQNSVITLDNSNSIIEFISNATITTPIIVHGNNNTIKGSSINNTGLPYQDYGNNNTININNKTAKINYQDDLFLDSGRVIVNTKNLVEIISGKKITTAIDSEENLSGDKKVRSELNQETSSVKKVESGSYDERVSGDKIETAENSEESITKRKIINAENIVLNSFNPLTYKTPEILDKNFNSIPMKDESGTEYEVLVYNGKPLNNGLFKSVKDYGALGDGTNDDTLAIQTCINENMFIIIPEGTYKITNELLCHSNCVIIGNGMLKSSANVEHVINLVAPTGQKYNNFHINGISFSGEFSTTTLPSCAVYVQRGNDITIENLHIEKYNQGVRVSESDNVTIRRITGKNFKRTSDRINGYGILTQDCENYVIEHCNIEAERHCIYLYDFENAHVKDCILSMPEGVTNLTGYELAIKCGGGIYATIENTRFDGCYGGVEIAGDQPDSKGSLNVFISNCLFVEERPVTTKAFSWVWTIETYSDNINVSDCLFFSTTGRSIAIEGGYNHFVNNCKFYNVSGALSAIRLSNETGNLISECNTFNNYNPILDLPEGNNKVVFKNNSFDGLSRIADSYNWKMFKSVGNINEGNYDLTDISTSTFNVDGWAYGTLTPGTELANLTGGVVGSIFYVKVQQSGSSILETGNLLLKSFIVAAPNQVVGFVKTEPNRWSEITRFVN